MASERLQRQIERLLDEAEDALNQDDWANLRRLADRVLLLDPGNSDAAAFLEVAQRAVTDSGSTPDPQKLTTQRSNQQVPDDNSPRSFSGGRYEVKKFLGEGGKKQVYLAHDSLLDREVAFALIKTEGLDDVSRTRISREAQAMGRLGSHPHIVTVFDLGEHEGQPYMVNKLS